MTRGRMSAVLVGSLVLATAGGVGGAVANSYVTSAQIEDETVRSVDVRDDSIRSRDITDGTVRWRDLAPWVQERSGQVAKPAGGVAGVEIVEQNWPGPREPYSLLTADCPTGKVVVGGGIRSNEHRDHWLHSSFAQDKDTWAVSLEDHYYHENIVTVQAICVTAD